MSKIVEMEGKTNAVERALGMSVDLVFGKIIPEEEREKHAHLQDKLFELCEKVTNHKNLSKKDEEFLIRTRNAVVRVSSAQNKGESDPLVADRKFRNTVEAEFKPLLCLVEAERKEWENEIVESPFEPYGQ